MLGVHRQQITDWISGRKAPTLEQGLSSLDRAPKSRLDCFSFTLEIARSALHLRDAWGALVMPREGRGTES